MNNRLNNINNSEALTKGRSQYIGVATDDTIIVEYENINIINMSGDGIEKLSPKITLTQKITEDTTTLGEGVLHGFKKIHFPKQIETIGVEAFASETQCEKANLENLKNIEEVAFAALSADVENPVIIKLDSAEYIGAEAFANAKIIVYLNENVRHVGTNAFIEVPVLHYSGNLEGAPWGAREWIKD